MLLLKNAQSYKTSVITVILSSVESKCYFLLLNTVTNASCCETRNYYFLSIFLLINKTLS